MNPALLALIARLESLGVAVQGTTLFAGSEADLPGGSDAFLTIIETGGYKAIPSHNDGLVSLRRPSFQITARAEDYEVAAELIAQTYNALTLTNTQVGSVFFLLSAPAQEPFSLPPDALGRVRMAFNLDTVYR